MKGWWATSTCQNGKWFHEPQCIGMCFLNISTAFIFSHADSAALWQCQSVSRSTILVQTEISQEHSDALQWNSVQTSMVPGGWILILMTSVTPWVCPLPPSWGHICVFELKVSTLYWMHCHDLWYTHSYRTSSTVTKALKLQPYNLSDFFKYNMSSMSNNQTASSTFNKQDIWDKTYNHME